MLRIRRPHLSRLATSVAFTLIFLASGCGDDENSGQDCGTPFSMDSSQNPVVIQGTITENLTFTADRQWLLRGGVFVGCDNEASATLTVEPGTTVFGETATNAFLSISRGSRIVASGSAAAPIVFTSSAAPGTRARGDWGGIIINGNATINGCATPPCEAVSEGGAGVYGGSNDADNSGTLRYVRIEFAGRLISADNELNGLAVQGGGSGTTLEFIQIHMGADDAVEFFGGTANFKYIYATGTSDDNLDWTDGWRGKGQFFVAQQYEDEGDNGIEADNNAENNTLEPRSGPVLSNLTLIGVPDSPSSDVGMLLREGTDAQIWNAVVSSWNDVGIDIDNPETFNRAQAGSLVVRNSIFNNADNFEDEADDPILVSSFITTTNPGNIIGNPGLMAPLSRTAPDFRPAAGSMAANGAVMPNDPFFTVVTFRGGMDPNDNWIEGWTTNARN